MTAPAPIAFANNGLELAALDWGGDGPDLVLLHPNGFCAGVYDPIARRLTDRYRVVGLDLPGHGATAVPDDLRRLGYDHAAGDVIALLDALGIADASLCGVSLGGGIALMTAAMHPERVRSVLACEAIVFPPDVQPPNRRGDTNPMAEIALKRRQEWPDRASVVASYGSRPPLSALAPEALEGYVAHGFHDADGGGVRLACPPEVEAAYFSVGPLGVGPFEAYDRLVDVRCPVTLVAGADTNLPHDYFRSQAGRLGVSLETLDGTHFFFFEDLDRAVELVVRSLGGATSPSTTS